MATVEKKNKGRQRIQMAKMTKESNLLVTFSKRRSGLFKKASEICTLCGVEVAIIVFSPGKKVFSFGHPCVETVIDRFLTRSPTSNTSNSASNGLLEAHRNANVRELNMQLTQVVNQLELEKKRGEMLNEVKRASQTRCWWEGPVEELGMEQLDQLKIALEELKNNVKKQADRVLIEGSSTNQFGGVGFDPSGSGPALRLDMVPGSSTNPYGGLVVDPSAPPPLRFDPSAPGPALRLDMVPGSSTNPYGGLVVDPSAPTPPPPPPPPPLRFDMIAGPSSASNHGVWYNPASGQHFGYGHGFL